MKYIGEINILNAPIHIKQKSIYFFVNFENIFGVFHIFHVKLHVCDLRWASLLKVIDGSSEILKIFQMRVILILIVKKNCQQNNSCSH